MKKMVILLCLFFMGFIFYMSSNNGEISHRDSNKVINLIKGIEAKLPIKDEKNTINENPKINKNTINAQQLKEHKLDYVIRKNAHVFMYMILAFLVSSVSFAFSKRGKYAMGNILFICLFFAVTDEFHQSFIPGRTALVSDVLVDFGGALIGVTLFYLTYYKIYIRYEIKKKSLEI